MSNLADTSQLESDGARIRTKVVGPWSLGQLLILLTTLGGVTVLISHTGN